jgi:hypothetical protein
MDSDDLTKDQAENLLVTIRPMLNFLHRLVNQMDKACLVRRRRMSKRQRACLTALRTASWAIR